MDKQPEALRLADVLEEFWGQYTGPEEPNELNAATELRRLYAENQGQAERIQDIYKQLNDTEKEADDLRLLMRQALDALELSRPAQCGQSDELWAQERAAHRSTIAAIKERLE